MGNEQSTNIPGIDIREKAVEVCDFWTQHSAVIFNQESSSHLTVFIGELFMDTAYLWKSQPPLQINSKHLMIYRHPCIVKYVSSWHKDLAKYYLAVEEITPLSQEIAKLSGLEISVGLHSILKALNFLHSHAEVSHNNLCISSIYVSKEGNWKLAGMEFLCKYKDLTVDYLNKCKSNRYSKSVDPNEEKLFQMSSTRKDFIDIYAFGVLASDLLKTFKDESDMDSLESFIGFCKNELLNTDFSKRPTFKSILEHEFFNNDFITINSFLLELPVKNDNEKLNFFQNLKHRLFKFEEELVASQLSGLLLSRLVLLNKTAQTSFLPFLLTPQTGDENEETSTLFSENTFKKYLCPKLLEIFKVRDVEIRLLLLSFFPKYMHTFNHEDLQNRILPELLVGIKDTNDHLVSVTLTTLALLVPVLGSETVVGGKRAKLFNDFRPTHSVRRSSKKVNPEIFQNSSTSAQIPQEADQISFSGLENELNIVSELPERPRPDGEEGETSTEEVEPSADEDVDNWDDWDINETRQTITTDTSTYRDNRVILIDESSTNIATSQHKVKIPDISELDIKTQSVVNEQNDINFFQDMEPVIESCNKFIVDESKDDIVVTNELSSKLAVSGLNDENNAGWEEEDWD
ncbi:protein-associating with the carboxyl-terminal domain of ezrin [Diabrotica virgifera virgifera]|uniref:Protein-associating with the carboxyl-terminal domain of ezrin n=1 Tax=Diabrotica virgifera virgifera TaxID=50390 RepID=A0A6P7FVQ9_DIAVI|nr:protein-associating with the carboxyl-terminal domain of ezrin [Diabrotica virgifera virgifera]